jgi:uncharacterized protein YbjT (DUF2867 family)
MKVILTGATGMVGEGVLIECLADPAVEKILVIGRRPSGYSHPKLTEELLNDFRDLTPAAAEKLAGYDACFFCAGVSSIGKNEDEYYKLTYDVTTGFAKNVLEKNPEDKLKFIYVSGYGTDSTEHGSLMWTRVKGKTENKLIEMFGSSAYMFRPGYMKPVKGQRNILKFYFGWQLVYPFMKLVMPRFTCTLAEAGKAMINCGAVNYHKNILEVKDIIEAAQR